MKLLDTLRDSDITPDTHNADPSNFSHRKAARAIVSNEQGQIAILKVGAHNYHKLPGGGVEEGENMEQALTRELLEEIGCEVEITGEVGEIVEYRKQQQMKQTSHCYTARQIGEQRQPAYTEKELADEMSIVWSTDIDEAISLLSHDEPTNYSGQFIRKRDLLLLKAAKALM